jgi:hypothetical protein
VAKPLNAIDAPRERLDTVPSLRRRRHREDTAEDIRWGNHEDKQAFECVFVAGKTVLVRETGEGLVHHQPVVQPKVEPETLDEGEPVTPAKGVGKGLGPGFGPSLAKGFDRSLAGSFAPVQVRILARGEVVRV